MEHAPGPAWAVALEATRLATFVRASDFLYPLANVLHIFGVALVLGAVVALDLRVLGLGRALPLRAVSDFLLPLIWIGLALVIPSGLLMFVADAGPLVGSTIFQVKMLLLVAALANAVLFRLLFDRRLANGDARAPAGGMLLAGLSLALWPAVIVAGRLLGYL
jgi:hypothetical protein